MTALRFLMPLCLAPLVSAPTGIVEGRVVSTAGGEGVRKARVVLRSAMAYVATTDSTGAFRIVGVVPGSYVASADRENWFSEQPSGFRMGPGQRVSDIVLRLTPTGVIAGRVLDADGDPVSKTVVEAVRLTYVRGRKAPAPANSITTNDRGEYRLFGLRPGSYYVRASTRSLPGAPSYLQLGNSVAPMSMLFPGSALSYYPSGNSIATATELDLPPGGEIGSLDIRISPPASCGLVVRMALPPVGGQRPSVSLAIQRAGADAAVFPVTVSGDTFRAMSLTPGRYVATAQVPDPQTPGRRLYWQQAVEIADQDVEITAVFRPALDVSGGLEGAPVKVSRVELVPAEGALQQAGPVVPVAGAFTFRNVVPDVYLLYVTIPEGGYVKAVHLGDRQLESERIDFAQASGRLRVVLGDDGGELSGLVVDAAGRPVPEAPIALAPLRADWPDLLKTALADGNGNFRLADIAPGEYRLFAWTATPPGAPESPEFRAPFEAKAQPVRVAANSEQRFTVTVLR
jgi:hypothetical protein